MRSWLYDLLVLDPDLQLELGGAEGITERVLPRRSQQNINIPSPFLIFGLGNDSNEQLTDDTATDEDAHAHRQFFQVWVHDTNDSYVKIDDLVEKIKRLLKGKSSKTHGVLAVLWLETSQEFSNQTYNTQFRYIRFQAIMAKGGTS